ncbi:MAG: recombinase family protein [Lachnospiraceae bacterium]|nr:recombinase family protein [Lachnospiraceae bacterium]
MKRVRILLRVSSNQQLEADGDLTIQRQLVKDYISTHEDWVLDAKEYFEGSNSGYKNSVADRDILQEALQDAQKKEYDILVAYKDDRIGRRMWEVGQYIMNLKINGVDIYTVKDGCISPESDDIMGQMVLALRYGNAQKSSADTGVRVKDTAQKLVQKGKFMGGAAPFGYELVLSGEISKHGRALHHLVIIPEQAEIVKYIYDLSLNKEYGSQKIASVLNRHDRYKNMAPNDVWKSGTVTSILTNPIYAGHTAYKRREHINGKYHRLGSEEWITSFEPNEDIIIIDGETWNRTQDMRKQRGDKYIKKLEHKDVNVIQRNDGMLALVDVCHCGYCGCKMVNGSKYSYWTIKDTGEKRASKTPIYKCQTAWQGVPHDKSKQYRADKIEPIVFDAIARYIGKLQENEDIFQEIENNQHKDKKIKENELKKEKQELDNIRRKIDILEGKVADAITGDYPLTLEQLVEIINKQKEQAEKQQEVIRQKEMELKNASVTLDEWNDIREKIPTWQDVFLNSDTPTKRVLVKRLIERIDVTAEAISIRFKINLKNFFAQPRISGGFGVQEPRLQLRYNQ